MPVAMGNAESLRSANHDKLLPNELLPVTCMLGSPSRPIGKLVTIAPSAITVDTTMMACKPLNCHHLTSTRHLSRAPTARAMHFPASNYAGQI